MNFDPFLGDPIENVDGIETFLIRASSSKNDDSIIFRVITHGAVGTLGGHIPGSFYLVPLHSGGVEGPDVVHVD